MEIDDVPGGLQHRLGAEGAAELLLLLDHSHQEARGELITACSDRFERRLVEETSHLRVQIAQVESTLRQDMATMGATLRQEMATMGATLRQEMTGMGATVRQDMSSMEGRLRADMAADRVEFIKWSFLFWVGQVLAITGIVGVMLRLIR